MFELQPFDPTFLAQPPHAFEHSLVLAVAPDRAFELVAHVEHVLAWFPDARAGHWVGDVPPGQGAQRDFRLSYMRLLEHFEVWEPGQRLVFWVSACSLPLLRRFAEAYSFAPEGGGTRVHWRVAYEPAPMLRWARPIVAPHFARTFRAAAKRLQVYARADAALKRRDDVLHHGLAPPERGGWGATLVTLNHDRPRPRSLARG